MNIKNKQQSWGARLRMVLKNVGKRKIIGIVMWFSIKGKTAMSHFLKLQNNLGTKVKLKKKNLTSPRLFTTTNTNSNITGNYHTCSLHRRHLT